MKRQLDRRSFLKTVSAGVGALGLGISPAYATVGGLNAPYAGPNVIVIRFGGGVRRLETIDPQNTYAPYFRHELTKRGVLFPYMEIAHLEGVDTSHGQGTLHILTGKYHAYTNTGEGLLAERFEASVPTLFEYLRKNYAIPDHQTLIINGEDRTAEEFYSFSNHHLFGVNFKSNTLSLYRFKVHLLRQQLAEGVFKVQELVQKTAELKKLEQLDYRAGEPAPSAEIESFWERWRGYYGASGLVNPRGDRLLAELAVRAITELRPKLMMVNFNDPDYVHWGNPTHYTRGITAIDDGIRRIVETADHDEAYRDNTVFVIVPDCGRDSNSAMAVPFQHHFNTRAAHDIFALVAGPGVPRGVVVDRVVDQTSLAATIGEFMGFRAQFAEGPALEEAFA